MDKISSGIMDVMLKKMAEDIGTIKSELIDLREEIDSLREVKSSYAKKLKNIEKRDKFHTYSSVEEFRKAIENV